MAKYEHEYESIEKSRKFVQKKENESDAAYYHRLAKQADTRLRRLEKLAGQDEYGNVMQYAYRSAVRELTLNFGANPKSPTFDRKLPRANNGEIIREMYNERLAVLKDFLLSPTSTKGGITEVYQKRAEKVNELYGSQLSWQDMADFFETGAAEKLFHDYGSKTVLNAIGTINTLKDIPSTALNNLNMKVPDKEKEAMMAILRRRSDYVDIGKRGSATRIKLRNMIKKL